MTDDATPGADRVRARVFVAGRVQGVGFRATTRRTAREHGVDGWVRNLDDGRVEAVFEGPPDDVAALVAFCEDGPRAARVDDVTEEREPLRGAEGFEVRR
jgi:acylphosphatase